MYMQGMHFSYALGMTIAPLAVEPFLSKERNVTSPSEEVTTVRDEGRIFIPYSIEAAALISSAVLILVLYFKVPYVDPKRTVSKTGD